MENKKEWLFSIDQRNNWCYLKWQNIIKNKMQTNRVSPAHELSSRFTSAWTKGSYKVFGSFGLANTNSFEYNSESF